MAVVFVVTAAQACALPEIWENTWDITEFDTPVCLTRSKVVALVLVVSGLVFVLASFP